jgi:sugar O-acyltransferase (sialic acid O-acetyltransferase NeuD family)
MKIASIIGYGELGQQFHNNLISLNYSTFFLFDDNYKKIKFTEYKNDIYKDSDFYVGLGYKNLFTKYAILNELRSTFKETPNFIHAKTFVNKTSIVEDAVFIYPMCNIDINVRIKLGSVINNSVVISHDSIIGNCCYISPGCIISGNVKIGDFTFVGAGAIISNNVTIGKNVIIGIGTVITNNIPDNCSVIGNPMRILKKKLEIK